MTFDDAILSRRLDWADAESMAGGEIEFLPEEGGAWVTLKVEEVERRASPPGTEQFSILMRSPESVAREQAMFRFRHARLGEYAVFVTPIERDAKGVLYQAVFAHDG